MDLTIILNSDLIYIMDNSSIKLHKLIYKSNQKDLKIVKIRIKGNKLIQ